MNVKSAWNIVRAFFSMKHYLKSWAKLALVSEVTSGFCAVLLAYLEQCSDFFMLLCVANMGMTVAFCIVGMHMEKLEKLSRKG